MAGLKAIKTKIRSVEKTQTVTKAMEAVSAAKMRKAQAVALSGRAYARAAVAILARVSGSNVLQNHPLTRGAETLFSSTRQQVGGAAGEVLSSAAGHHGDAAEITSPAALRALYIVITSDKGLAGALNSAVLRATAADIQSIGLKPEHVLIIAVGKKANEFFSMRGYQVAVYHPNTLDLTDDIVGQLVNEVAFRFADNVVDIVKIVYQNFVSTFEQHATMRTIFPLSLVELERVVHDMTPKRGAFAHTNGVEPVNPKLYTVEPSEEEVFSNILPKLAGIFVYHALLESQASEHSARMVAMKSASDKAEEMEHSLTLQFNKARQAAITREVSEITGGMEAMAA